MKLSDIQKKAKNNTCLVTARISIENKSYIKKNKINLAKLIDVAIQELKRG